jgi:hypothetical protein
MPVMGFEFVLFFYVIVLLVVEIFFIFLSAVSILSSISYIKKLDLKIKKNLAVSFFLLSLSFLLIFIPPFLVFSQAIETASTFIREACYLRYVFDVPWDLYKDSVVACFQHEANVNADISGCAAFKDDRDLECVLDNAYAGGKDCSGFDEHLRKNCLNIVASVSGDMSICNDDAFSYYYDEPRPERISSSAPRLNCILEVLNSGNNSLGQCSALKGQEFIDFCHASELAHQNRCKSYPYHGYLCEKLVCGDGLAPTPNNYIVMANRLDPHEFTGAATCIAMYNRSISLCGLSDNVSSCEENVIISMDDAKKCENQPDPYGCIFRMMRRTVNESCNPANLSIYTVDSTAFGNFPIECGFVHDKSNKTPDEICGSLQDAENQDLCKSFPSVIAYSCLNTTSVDCGFLCRSEYCHGECSLEFDSTVAKEDYYTCLAEMNHQ